MHPFSLRRLLWAGPLATAAAVLVNLLFFSLTKALGEQYILPLDGSSTNLGPMSILMPVVVTLVPGLLATILFGLLLRFARSNSSASLFRWAVLSPVCNPGHKITLMQYELNCRCDHYSWNTDFDPEPYQTPLIVPA